MKSILEKASPVIPVITIDNVADALPLAEALIAGGLNSVEVTLRTSAAMEAIQEFKQVDGLMVGVGTVSSPKQYENLAKLDVDFIVSPGSTKTILKVSQLYDIPYLPGISSASELMLGLEYEIDAFKVFPAGAVNALELIKGLSAPFPNVHFCPTGGINANNMEDFLSLKSVPCVGGTWIAPLELIKEKRWDEISARAAATHSKSH